MNWKDHEEAGNLIKKLEAGERLTHEEIQKLWLKLLKDYYDRGLE